MKCPGGDGGSGSIENLRTIRTYHPRKFGVVKQAEELNSCAPERCRLCLKYAVKLQPIFDSKLSLATRIFACLSIQVVENKYLPLHICEECLYELDRCYKFRNKCQLNDKKLKSHLRTLELKPQACPEEKRALEIAEKLLLKVMPKQVHANCEETELPMAVTLLPLALTIPPTQRLSCQQCGKTFVSAGSQRRHRLVHTGERPWVCPTCGRAFAQKVVLQRHRLVHLEKRPFACTECEKSFTQREALRAHTTTHLPPARRPMRLRTCPYCPKLFRHSSGLSRHLLVHTGRQFACRHCSRLFADKSSLRRHARTRHESPPPPQPLPPLPCERVAETTPP